MRNIDELIERLPKVSVKGDHPLSFYVRKLKYSKPEVSAWITEKQLIAVLEACDQLRDINIYYFLHNVHWPSILIKQKKLQHFLLDPERYWHEQKYSFWRILRTLTSASPDIQTIILGGQLYKEDKRHSKTSSISINTARALNPCRNLEKVLVYDEVWTIPYLKYLTIMAPNLVQVRLHLKYERNLTQLKTTLEASLEVWSKTLRKLWICYVHDLIEVPKPKGRPSRLLPITFPVMEKLEKLKLVGVQISGASLYNLSSLASLTLAYTEHDDIIDSLVRHSVLEKLTELVVNEMDSYREVKTRRKNLNLRQWEPSRFSIVFYGRTRFVHWSDSE